MTKGNDEAPRKISELTLRKTRHAAGFEDDEEATPAEKPPSTPAEAFAPSEQAEAAAVTIRLNPRQKLEKAISDNPTHIPSYLALAELHTNEGRYPDAVKVLTRALAQSDDDLKIRELLEMAQIRRGRAQLIAAEKKAVSLQTPQATEGVKKLRSELNQLELEIYQSRCQRHPEDTGLKYELGVRLKRTGNYSEAVGYLSQAQADPKHQAAATLELGECYQQMRQYTKALECYAGAADHAEEDSERKKLALYRAGVLAHGLKEAATAVRHLTELVKIDPDFRDAAARLDKSRRIGHK
jgi:tetratricopeptide (TPR) repeat protein